MKLYDASEESSITPDERNASTTGDGSGPTERPAGERCHSTRRALSVYVISVIVFTVIPVIVVSALGLLRSKPFDPNLLLFGPAAPFSDFTDFSHRVVHFGERDMLTRPDLPIRFPYPLTTLYAFLLFVRVFPNPLAAYLTFVVAAFAGAAATLSIKVHHLTSDLVAQIAIWTTLFTAFPLLFLIERGNIEAVVWLIIVLGIAAFVRDHFKTAALLLSLAACMKIFPVLLLGLFLAKRRYWEFCLSIAAMACISVLSLYGVGPTISHAFADYSEGAAYLRQYFINAPPVPRIDHSAFGIPKLLIYIHARSVGQLATFGPSIGLAVKAYTYAVAVGVAALYIFRLRKLPILNQLISYLALCTLLPYVSYEYTLVYIFIVWGALLWFLLSDVSTGLVEVPQPAINVMMVSCALIFAPITYVGLPGGALKTLCLVTILVVAVSTPMPSTLFQDAGAVRRGRNT